MNDKFVHVEDLQAFILLWCRTDINKKQFLPLYLEVNPEMYIEYVTSYGPLLPDISRICK